MPYRGSITLMEQARLDEFVDTLTLPELDYLVTAAQRWIRQIESWQQPNENTLEIVASKKGYYRLEYVKCGKEKCKCAKGDLHGPYWYLYSYSSAKGRQKKTYIGKNRPAE